MTSTEELSKKILLWDETIELWSSIPRVSFVSDDEDVDWTDDDWTVSFPTACSDFNFSGGAQNEEC